MKIVRMSDEKRIVNHLIGCKWKKLYIHLFPSIAPCWISIFVSDRLLLRTATSNGDKLSLFKLFLWNEYKYLIERYSWMFMFMINQQNLIFIYLFISTSVDSRIVRAFSKWPFSTAANRAENENSSLKYYL